MSLVVIRKSDYMIPNEVNIVLSNIWPMLLLFVIVLFSMRIIDVIINKNKLILYRDLYLLSFILYMLLLFELVTTTDFESYSNNFIPFKEIMRYSYTSKLFFKNVLGNVLLFVPFGYFVNKILKNKKMIVAVFITLITSLSIELIQINIGRSFDIDDIILNLLGGIVGYLFYRLLEYIKEIIPNWLKKEWIYNILWILILILGSIIILDYYNVLEVL